MLSLIRPRLGGGMLFGATLAAAVLGLVLASCGETDVTVLRIGAVHPLTGEGNVYGLPVKRVIERAVADVNAAWDQRGKKLEIIIEDGKCSSKDALAAARKLVQDEGIRVIYGGSCSSETLGMAPYTEEQRVLLLTPLSSSDEISGAGDYVFRNTAANSSEVDAVISFLRPKGYRTFALLTEDTDYAQDLRRSYLEAVARIGGQIVVDEVVADGATNVEVEARNIAAAQPDAVIVLPQTIPSGGRYAAALHSAGVSAQGISNSVLGVPDAVSKYGQFTEGYLVPRVVFKGEGRADYQALLDATDCTVGYYCAAAYDGVILLAEALDRCGDTDATCIKDFLNDLQGWEGPFYGTLTFDENGDILGSNRNLPCNGSDHSPGKLVSSIRSAHSGPPPTRRCSFGSAPSTDGHGVSHQARHRHDPRVTPVHEGSLLEVSGVYPSREFQQERLGTSYDEEVVHVAEQRHGLPPSYRSDTTEALTRTQRNRDAH